MISSISSPAADLMKATNPRRDRSAIVFLIGLFRLFKALLLLAGGAAALELMRPEQAMRVRQWLAAIRYADDHRWLQHLIATVTGLDARQAMIAAIAAFAYAALFIVEGTGLILGRPWAEWVTVIATASFVPFEGYELVRRPSPAKGIILFLNIAIVIYLAWRIRRRQRKERGEMLRPGGPGGPQVRSTVSFSFSLEGFPTTLLVNRASVSK